MIFLLVTELTLAAGPWAGVDPGRIDVLGDALFLEPEAGWVAPIVDEGGGRVRVFVGRDEVAAHEWVARTRAGLDAVPPTYPFADEALGNGHSLLLFRDGNVAVWVDRPGGGALDLGERLHEALDEDSDWPEAPVVTVEGLRASAEGSWTQLSFRPAPRMDPATYLPVPIRVVPGADGTAVLGGAPTRVEVVGWDRYGRFATATWTAEAP